MGQNGGAGPSLCLPLGGVASFLGAECGREEHGRAWTIVRGVSAGVEADDAGV